MLLLLSVPLVLLLVPALLLQLMGRGAYVVTAIGPREETFPYATINTSDNAYLDVKAIEASDVGVRMLILM